VECRLLAPLARCTHALTDIKAAYDADLRSMGTTIEGGDNNSGTIHPSISSTLSSTECQCGILRSWLRQKPFFW